MHLPLFFRKRENQFETSYYIFRSSIRDHAVTSTLKMCTDVQRANCKTLHILFSSTGGSMRCAVDLYNMLRGMPFKTVMWNMGHIGSAANIVYLAGSHRNAVPASHFLLHQATKSFDSKRKLHEHELLKALNILKVQQELFKDIVCSRTSLSAKQFYVLRDTEKLINADLALDVGLIHAIGEPLIPGHAKVFRCIEHIKDDGRSHQPKVR